MLLCEGAKGAATKALRTSPEIFEFRFPIRGRWNSISLKYGSETIVQLILPCKRNAGQHLAMHQQAQLNMVIAKRIPNASKILAMTSALTTLL